MKKFSCILFLFLITNFAIGQGLSRFDLIEKITFPACECLVKKKLNEKNVEENFKTCVLTQANKFPKETAKYFGKNYQTDTFAVLAEAVLKQMEVNCPNTLGFLERLKEGDKKLSTMPIEPNVIVTSAEQLSVKGFVFKFVTDGFRYVLVEQSPDEIFKFVLMEEKLSAASLDNLMLEHELLEFITEKQTIENPKTFLKEEIYLIIEVKKTN